MTHEETRVEPRAFHPVPAELVRDRSSRIPDGKRVERAPEKTLSRCLRSDATACRCFERAQVG